MVVLVAGVSLVESLQVVEDSLPGTFLLWRVFNSWNLLSTGEMCLFLNPNLNKVCILLFVKEGDVSKFLPSLSVDRISKPRVV